MTTTAASSYRPRARTRRDEIQRRFFEDGQSPRDIADELGLNYGGVLSVLRSIDPDWKLRAPGRENTPVFSDADLTAMLRHAAAGASTVSETAYRRQVSEGATLPDGRKFASSLTVAHRFGGWNAAVAAAGLQPRASTNVRVAFDLQACLQAVRTARTALNATPTCDTYHELTQRQPELGLPSVCTLRNRFREVGGWKAGVRAAIG